LSNTKINLFFFQGIVTDKRKLKLVDSNSLLAQFRNYKIVSLQVSKETYSILYTFRRCRQSILDISWFPRISLIKILRPMWSLQPNNHFF